MDINFEKNRNLMVENQLRPNKITDPIILNLFKKIKKEDFLSEHIRDFSYNDLNIDLDDQRGYLKNLHIAQMIHSANIIKVHKVLHLGGLTGYVSSILSFLCKELIVIENQKDFVNQLEINIDKLSIKNIKIITTSFYEGFLQDSPYDIIFIDNPVNGISDFLKDQVSSESGKIIMIKKLNNNLCKAYKITRINNNYFDEFLFDIFCQYLLFKKKKDFIF